MSHILPANFYRFALMTMTRPFKTEITDTEQNSKILVLKIFAVQPEDISGREAG
jgi:hypothetical protein